VATTYTPKRGLQIPAFKDRNWHLPLINSLTMLDTAIDGGALAIVTSETPSTTLHFAVASGDYCKADGTVATFAGAGPVTATDNANTYVWLTNAGTLTTGPTYPTGVNIVRIGSVVALSGVITAVRPVKVVDASFGAPRFDYTAPYSANMVVAGPASGSPAPLAVRYLVPGDLPVFVASGASSARGAVPDPGSTAGTRRLLCEDGTWKVSPVFIGSGSTHAVGAVPDPGATFGTSRVLFENATWGQMGTRLPLSTYSSSPAAMVGTSIIHMISASGGVTFNLVTLTSLSAVYPCVIWIHDQSGAASSGGNAITITPAGSDSLNGSGGTTQITTPHGSACLLATATGWYRLV